MAAAGTIGRRSGLSDGRLEVPFGDGKVLTASNRACAIFGLGGLWSAMISLSLKPAWRNSATTAAASNFGAASFGTVDQPMSSTDTTTARLARLSGCCHR